MEGSLPRFLGLCPEPTHTMEFYLPLDRADFHHVCPMDDCSRELRVFVLCDEPPSGPVRRVG